MNLVQIPTTAIPSRVWFWQIKWVCSEVTISKICFAFVFKYRFLPEIQWRVWNSRENIESTDQGCPFTRFVPPLVFTCVHGVSSRKARGTLHGVCLWSEETKTERDSQRKKWELMTQRKTFCAETCCKFIALYQLIFIYITFRWVIIFHPIMPLLFVFYFMFTA